MTIDEIQVELERLKELTNDTGKGIVTRLQQEIRLLKIVVGDRRNDVRDLGEKDQHLAKKLHLI